MVLPAPGSTTARWKWSQVTPARFRKVCLFAVWALVFIIVSGAAVRLTGSGLGCKDWPSCRVHPNVKPWRYHEFVEFGNRLVTLALTVAIIAAVLFSVFRAPRRRDLVWLSSGLMAGLVGEIVLGGIVVLYKLAPQLVMAHFMYSFILLLDGLVLYHRAGFADGPADERGWARPAAAAQPVVSSELRAIGGLLLASVSVVIFLGTIVTSTGPHGGDPTARRFDLSLHDVAKLHSSAVILFLGLTVVTLWRMLQSGAPRDVIRRGEVLLVVLVIQGAVGYIQYLSGVPAWLVQVHVTLAAALWVVALQFFLALTRRPGLAASPVPAGDAEFSSSRAASGSALAPA
ncbi:MAG: COX15/CtaA family protein [Acidimicrobiales bacterium]